MPSGTSLVNKKFGSLTVLRETVVQDIYVCKCKCGTEVELFRSQLVKDVTRHCGCRSPRAKNYKIRHYRLRRGRDGKLNTFATDEWCSWYMMKERCCYKTTPNYPEYGGRGIRICPQWLEPKGQGFRNFLDDMGPRPVGLSLDRINVQGHYEPGNCRWADWPTQCSNQRRWLFKDGDVPPVVPMDIAEEEALLAGTL